MVDCACRDDHPRAAALCPPGPAAGRSSVRARAAATPAVYGGGDDGNLGGKGGSNGDGSSGGGGGGGGGRGPEPEGTHVMPYGRASCCVHTRLSLSFEYSVRVADMLACRQLASLMLPPGHSPHGSTPHGREFMAPAAHKPLQAHGAAPRLLPLPTLTLPHI